MSPARPTRLLTTCALALSLFVQACGGGGGGSSSASSPAAPPAGVPDTPAVQLSLLAGWIGGRGNLDGAAAVARFQRPTQLAVDGGGNIYVADRNNDAIRKITPAGAVSTLAGGQTQGSADGTGRAASFLAPSGIAVTTAGTVYVADTANHTVRRISPAGVVTTLAGTAGVQGINNGAGAAASFSGPSALALDNAGNILLVEQSAAVRQVTPAGVVTTRALLPTLGNAIAVDGADNLYVALDNGDLRVIEPGGAQRTLATGLDPIYGLAVNAAGTVYAVTLTHTVLEISAAGVVNLLAGQPSVRGGADGTGGTARFDSPQGIALAAGGLLVADTANATIRRVTFTGQVSTFAGSPYRSGAVDGTGDAARFEFIGGVAIGTDGMTYATDENRVIRRITRDGVTTVLAGTFGAAGALDGTGAAARFRFPLGMTRDPSGNLYVSDSSAHTIRKITPAGVVTTFAGADGSQGSADGTGSAARFNQPWGLGSDAAGNVYVADWGNHTVRKITPAGVVTTVAGTAGASGYVDGTGAVVRFDRPNGVSVDASGNLYVSETPHTIRKITPTGVVTTLAGNRTPGRVDGTGTAARLSEPRGLVALPDGTVYVADTANSLIRKISPAGVVTTVIGSAARRGTGLGPVTTASVDEPYAIAVSPDGRRLVITSSFYGLVQTDGLP
jgi:sugar lactone lactonase YvrE